MRQKVAKWNSHMTESMLPAHLQIESYIIRLWPQINYGLGVTQLKREEIKKIVAPEEKVVQRAYYLGSTFSGEILHLPENNGVHFSYTQMVCEQENMVICALRRDDNTGKKTRILLDYHQLECGERPSILEKSLRG